MNSLRFYFDHSLIGFCYRRAREKWFTGSRAAGGVISYHGVDIRIDNMCAAMQKHLLSGGYEAAELQLVRSLVGPGDRVLELGGAIGFIGLFCRKVLRADDVVSVEPNAQTLAQLRRNYRLNGIEPNTIQAALAEHDGPLRLSVSGMFWADSVVARESASSLMVEGLTFESLLRKAGSNFNTLIIDVEGAEQFISCSSIPNSIAKVMVEIHPDLIGKKKAYSFLGALIQAGFAIEDNAGNSWALTRTV